MNEEHVDLLVVGSGAGGLSAAVTGMRMGLKVLVVEKEEFYGGTTTASGGILWVPRSKHSADRSERERKKALDYLLDETGNYGEGERLEAFLDAGPKMVDFMEENSDLRFYGMEYPDYHTENPNSSIVRSICAADFPARALGKHLKQLKGPLPQTLFLGLAVGSGAEMKQFLKAGRSIRSLGFVGKKIARYILDLIRYGQSQQVVRGRALIAGLAKTLFDSGVEIRLSSPMRELLKQDGRVIGAVVDGQNGSTRILAKCGVVLACGGYPADAERREATFPPALGAADHRTPTPAGNTGDGIRSAEAIGGIFNGNVSNAGAWMVISLIPGVEGSSGVWPHVFDRHKPGFIAVMKDGKRFANESESYHDFCQRMVKAAGNDRDASGWLICDALAIKRYGIGAVRPFPVPFGHHLRSGYLTRASSIVELAGKIDVDPGGLLETVESFNSNAREGRDPDFGRGERVYDHYQGDEENLPNVCVRPLDHGPFYAVKIYPSEIGTFAGLRTDTSARVLDAKGHPIEGLYAVGNDQGSVFGGAYPGAGATLGPAMTFGYIAGRHAAGESWASQ